MEDDDMTQLDMLNDPEHLAPTGVPAMSVGLAAEEQREAQGEPLPRFSPFLPVLVSDSSAPVSPRVFSDDSDGDIPIPDPDDSDVVRAVSRDGFTIVDDDTPTWTVSQFPFHEHVPVSI
jgi:hypothetical protein